jgi:hypothetical protein
LDISFYPCRNSLAKAVKSANMLRTTPKYLNKDVGVLEHFRYPEAFAMRYCRKLFATYMRKHPDTELVDLLQGRVPTSIFARYYNRPNYLDELSRISLIFAGVA